MRLSRDLLQNKAWDHAACRGHGDHSELGATWCVLLCRDALTNKDCTKSRHKTHMLESAVSAENWHFPCQPSSARDWKLQGSASSLTCAVLAWAGRQAVCFTCGEHTACLPQQNLTRAIPAHNRPSVGQTQLMVASQACLLLCLHSINRQAVLECGKLYLREAVQPDDSAICIQGQVAGAQVVQAAWCHATG